MSDIVDAEWARDGINAVEHAIAQINLPQRSPVTIAWGYANDDDADLHQSGSTDFQVQAGLLNFLNTDFELLINQHGDPESHPNPCEISTRYSEPKPLPVTARELYNVLASCDSVSITLVPDAESTTILATGVRTCVPVESLSGRTLYDALFRLLVSRDATFDWLAEKQGDDRWSMDSRS